MTDHKLERLNARLAQPDGIVFRSDIEIVDEISPFVTALVGPQGPGLGSGVLVSLWERHFILTAGHVVRAVQELKGLPVQLVIANQSHNAKFDLVQRGFVCGNDDDDSDYGFFELPAYDASRVKARDKFFASYKRLHVSAHLADDDVYVVSGFPADLADRGLSQTWMKPCFWAAEPAGTRNVPASSGPTSPYVRVIDLCIDPEDGLTLDFWDRNKTPWTLRPKDNVDPMPGVSGGPCWRTFVRDAPETWDPKRLRLVGTHRGHTKDNKYARQVGIGHHLQLIATAYPDLKGRIYEEWPAVEAYPHESSAKPR